MMRLPDDLVAIENNEPVPAALVPTYLRTLEGLAVQLHALAEDDCARRGDALVRLASAIEAGDAATGRAAVVDAMAALVSEVAAIRALVPVLGAAFALGDQMARQRDQIRAVGLGSLN